MKRLIKEFVGKCREVKDLADLIGRTICESLQDILPELRYSVGWEEAGIDCVCFYLDDVTRGLLWLKRREKLLRYIAGERVEDLPIDFEDIVVEVFPELRGHIDCPFGVYVTEEEADRIRERLKELSEEV